MDALVLEGPSRLKGAVSVSGSKNAALPCLFASILADKKVYYENIPRLWDIETTLSILKNFGMQTEWNKESGAISILPTVNQYRAPYEWVKKMRASILALGPLLAKYGSAQVSLPGGCAIGARPVNFHLEALKKLGAEIEVESGYILAKAPKGLKGERLKFPQVSVTGTENLMMAAVVSKGVTVLENAAIEPEVIALGKLLKLWGAKIEGLGTSLIQIEGGSLAPSEKTYAIPSDRIETGTWLAASIVTESPIILENVPWKEIQTELSFFKKLGADWDWDETSKKLAFYPKPPYQPQHIETAPYPNFPTDMQAQAMVCLCLARGKSRIQEKIFENRYMHVAELVRMGAKIEVHGNEAVIEGPIDFKGAPVMATDLRASASLVLAALRARGKTKISRIYHLDRGYQKLDQKLQGLGVFVSRIQEGL